jgi:hypothetical protein
MPRPPRAFVEGIYHLASHASDTLFFARELTNDAGLLVACRYVAHNAVAAGLCTDPFSWPWSSTAASAGLAQPAIPLDPGPLRAPLGDSNDWQRRYREFMKWTKAKGAFRRPWQ